MGELPEGSALIASSPMVAAGLAWYSMGVGKLISSLLPRLVFLHHPSSDSKD